MADIIIPGKAQRVADGDWREKRKQRIEAMHQQEAEAKRRSIQAKREARNFALARRKRLSEGPYHSLCLNLLSALGISPVRFAVLYGGIPDFLIPRKIILQVSPPAKESLVHIWTKKKYRVVPLDNQKLSSKEGLIYLRDLLASLGLKV
jgi:hypothetical protein